MPSMSAGERFGVPVTVPVATGFMDGLEAPRSRASAPRPEVVLVGGCARDIVGRVDPAQPSQAEAPGTSQPGAVTHSDGGVCRNVAENLLRLGVECLIVSAVGDDANGAALVGVWPCLARVHALAVNPPPPVIRSLPSLLGLNPPGFAGRSQHPVYSSG